MFHERTIYIDDVRLHFIRDIILQGRVKLNKVPNEENPVKMLTKVLPITKYRRCLNLLQITDD